MIAIARTVVLGLFAAACASALHEPTPVERLAPGHANGRSVEELVRDGDAAWARRAEPGQAAIAQGLYLDAAASDHRRVAPLIAAMKALSFRVEHDRGAPRAQLAGEEVELGQWCQRRAPTDPACDYRLAIALGQQARERPATGHDALGKIVSLLRRAIALDPRLDAGGPHRVLALVLLRAPAWPIGPGDPDTGLTEARAAVQLFPDNAENQLALAEAFAATDGAGEARTAYGKAVALAERARAAGDPDAARQLEAARAGMTKVGGR